MLKLLPLALCVNKFPHTRLLAIFNGALPPLAGNYLCCKMLRKLYADNGNIKEKPAPSKLQLKAVDIQGVSEDLFEMRQRYFLSITLNRTSPGAPEQKRKGLNDKRICFANRQYRQQLVVSSTAEGCASRDATRRCCQSGRHKLDIICFQRSLASFIA